MNGADIIPILKRKRIEKFYHANTVTTSVTFLRLGGLASRGYVERNGHKQTSQRSDRIDKRYGIWDDVFMDTDDLHERMSRRNQYGPVSFEFDVKFLNELPAGTDVRVTKLNPDPKWKDNDTESTRYFMSLDELEAGLVKGRTDHIITFRIPGGLLPFPSTGVVITLDDPERALYPPKYTDDAYETAYRALVATGTAIRIAKRACSIGCTCRKTYHSWWSVRRLFDQL